MALVRDLDILVPERHACRVLLCRNGALLGVILYKGNAPTARHQSDLAEALEAAKDARKALDVVLFGDVLQEQNLVGRQVFVGDDGGLGDRRRLEARRLGNLGRAAVGTDSGGTAFPLPRALGSFDGLFLFYTSLLASNLTETAPMAA